MIIKASQRSGAKQLGLHLLNVEQNEHVELHEVRGFIAEDLMGAMKEAHALSCGVKAKQHIFSVSLNPPSGVSVRAEVFERACDMIEERLGLKDQPRVIVFHEKEGRRHAHAVWSRVDTETMTAKPLSFFKRKLNEIGKELYLENGWQMPNGFRDARLRDPRNVTRDEWQQAQRVGLDAREVKANIQEAWAASDNQPSFATALEERGLFLAQGDRRGHVVVSMEGEVFPISRMISGNAKDVRAKLGDPSDLPSVAATVRHIGEKVAPKLSAYISQAKRLAHEALKPLNERKETLKKHHQKERNLLAHKQAERQKSEQQARSDLLRKGVTGVWDMLTGRYFKTRKQNEMETFFGLQRDRAQRHDLIAAQLKDRRELQKEFKQEREKHSRSMLGLYRSASRYRDMARGGRDDRSEARAREHRPRGRELGM